MLKKIAGLARILATLLAIVAGVVTLGSVNVGLILLVLGLIAGLGYEADDGVRLFLVVLVLQPVALALGLVPEVGDKLAAIASNIMLAAAGAAATVIALRIFNNSKADVTGLTAK